jgi:hypothetical protein
MLAQFETLREGSAVRAEEFEKDDDQNGHIDYIHAFGNLRAMNYRLEEMDWVTVKIKVSKTKVNFCRQAELCRH